MSEYFDEEEEKQTQLSPQTLRRILAQTKPHWKWVAGFMASAAVVSVLDSVFAYLRKMIVDDAILGGNQAVFAQALLLYGGTILAQAVGVFAFIYLVGILGQRIEYDLRCAMFDHLQELSFDYFNRRPVGWIMARVTSDSERVAHLVTWGLLDVTWGLLNIATAAVFMYIINWRLALIVLLMLPILLVVASQFQKRILSEYRRVRRLNSRITAAYNENIIGVRVVKALCREEENLREFSELSGAMYRSSYRAAWLSALFLPTVQIISALGAASVIGYGGWQTQWGTITIGGIQAFLSYIGFMMWPIQDLARVYAELQHAVASGERIFSLLDTPPTVADKPGAVEVDNIRGDISFEHVYFDYDPETPVLEDFNLYVKQGEAIALVGPTGGGKTTIVNLLCRFYEPCQGVIRIAGRDYTTLTLHSIQSRIGVVLQTPHLFSGTIRENIRYGRLGATDAEVEEAARIAGAHDFIVKLAHGYDTEVGEGGQLLSVGQKQLISLARAVLAQPDIFVMDEATSSVDTLTEAYIQRGMEALMKGRTSFIIAHRLSTVKRADRILFIDHGRIVEAGSHAALLRARGRYYQLYVQQFQRELERQQDYFLAAEGLHPTTERTESTEGI
ncbi:MAG: ABC transporter ATP-binding protein [Chloroflexi bacterium]|nr:ABC transporter ATP-binding protein [Chloroflexota bacterium]